MRRRRLLLLVAVAVVPVLVAAAFVVRWAVSDRSAPLVAAAWLPAWDDRASASLTPAVDVGGVTEVSPTWLTLGTDGALVVTQPPAEVRDQLRDAGLQVLPTVQNFADGQWQGQVVADLLADAGRAEAHREELVRLVTENGWDGLDVDYESLPPTAGPVFTEFLTALADDLHARDLELTVAVPARAADDDPGTLAYSYQQIGAVADQVRVMAYDHAWSDSAAGPVAPVDWVRSVARYAVDRVPEEKLMLGLATYGYDWVGEQGAVLGAADAVALAERVGARPRWDDAAAAVTFTYTENGQEHTVWFEDARALAAKQDVAVEHGLRGVAIWRLGGEDPAVWPTVAGVTTGGAEA
ncbi:glycosyl hydrolase family 18 protein [Geodermatophilus sp. SYSU D01045]